MSSESLIEIDVTTGQPEITGHTWRAQIAGHFDPAGDPDISQLVVEHLEVVGGDVELHAAHATFVKRNITAE